MPDQGAIFQKYGPMNYNDAQKWCHEVSGSDEGAKITEWDSRKNYQLLFDLAGGDDIWAGFSDFGHPGKWKDGTGQGKPQFVPWKAGQEILLDANVHPTADCAFFEAASSDVMLGDCTEEKFFFCDE